VATEPTLEPSGYPPQNTFKRTFEIVLKQVMIPASFKPAYIFLEVCGGLAGDTPSQFST
jgi:hypothetical protein